MPDVYVTQEMESELYKVAATVLSKWVSWLLELYAPKGED